jgi:hypothetical protein
MSDIRFSHILDSPKFKALDMAGQFELLSVELTRQLSRKAVYVTPYSKSGLEKFRAWRPDQQRLIVSHLIAYALSLEELDMTRLGAEAVRDRGAFPQPDQESSP